MKKILFILLVFILFKSPSYAVITTDDVTSPTYIQAHGHSVEMSRLIDLENAQINGVKTKFIGSDPAWYTQNPKVNFIRKAFMYFDCGLDDGNFMNHDIKFTPRYDDL